MKPIFGLKESLDRAYQVLKLRIRRNPFRIDFYGPKRRKKSGPITFHTRNTCLLSSKKLETYFKTPDSFLNYEVLCFASNL